VQQSLTHNQHNRFSLHRSIDWTGAFWLASGVPALVLFSMGAIAATVGKPAWLIWIVSISLGLVQAFTYAEVAGLFPHKTGGISVHSSVAWANYNKWIAALCVWCNWVAWGPVLAIGSALAAGYILNVIYPPDAVINTWQITLLDLSFLKAGLSLRINAVFIIGAVMMILVFAIQNGGILRSAKAMMIISLSGLMPLMLIAIVPLITGDLRVNNFYPLTPLAYDSEGYVVSGVWDMAGWSLVAGALFIAAWSTYAFETAVCYTREFKQPSYDTQRALLYSGLLCLFAFVLIPFTFQGHIGLGQMIEPQQLNAEGLVIKPAQYDGMLAADIYSGMGIANAFYTILGGSGIVIDIFVVMLVLALMLAIMTTMSGSSRTLYQGSIDGLLPKYLSQVNQHGAPTSAMWTNLIINLMFLALSDYVFLLASSCVSYIIFNFLTLNSGWIHRLDRPNWKRSYRTPKPLFVMGIAIAFLNVGLMAFGANIWGSGTLLSGLILASISIPLFCWRHYLMDKGELPLSMQEDIQAGHAAVSSRKAGLWPYLALFFSVLLVGGIQFILD
jgi:amino acid transporter|tara:strand:- start:126635 stop:128305 length:1671 start_codon:yes stop_codon:yes gene_type:complete